MDSVSSGTRKQAEPMPQGSRVTNKRSNEICGLTSALMNDNTANSAKPKVTSTRTSTRSVSRPTMGEAITAPMPSDAVVIPAQVAL